MKIDLTGIVVIVGNYGSGKTEVAVNLAAHQKAQGKDVSLVDLDLVNPYFRSREAKAVLNAIGIEVVMPPERYFHADLPILTPEVSGRIRSQSAISGKGLLIIDAGGDDVGATVLASLKDAIKGKRVEMLQVVNPFRPYTDTLSGCERIRREIESASQLTVTGIVGNANLIDETTPEEILNGYKFMVSLSEETGLPLFFVTAVEELMVKLDLTGVQCPILPVRRQLVPPWKNPKTLSASILDA
jgi:hypothetical protein